MNVSHTGTALTVVTTLVTATLYVMAVTDQLLPIVTTVSFTLHGAQDSVPVITHILVKNVTTVLTLKPQHNKPSPNRTTATINTEMDLDRPMVTIVPNTSKTNKITMLMMDTITHTMMVTPTMMIMTMTCTMAMITLMT